MLNIPESFVYQILKNDEQRIFCCFKLYLL